MAIRVKMSVTGMEEVFASLREWPDKMSRVIHTALESSNLVMWESVPPYPDAPEDSSYVRTGTLGRTLGVSQGGGKSGSPDIFTISGEGMYQQAGFGTRLNYSSYVIGDRNTPGKQGGQAAVHKDRWWTLPQTVVEAARPKIKEIFEAIAEEISAWFDRRA